MEIAESVPIGHVRQATTFFKLQATNNFYNFMRAFLRQETILSLGARVVAPCAFTPIV